jgi:hypothetical protein
MEATLAGSDALILAAGCVRDDTLRPARETTPRTHPELRRYRKAGSNGAALLPSWETTSALTTSS